MKVSLGLNDLLHADRVTVAKTKNLTVLGVVPVLIPESKNPTDAFSVWWPVEFYDQVTDERFVQWVCMQANGVLLRLDNLPIQEDYRP